MTDSVARHEDLVITRWSARFKGRVFSCAIGIGGIAAKDGEGDGITPQGVWSVEYGYYRCDRHSHPNSFIPFVPISFRGGWSDDTRDKQYNEPVTLPHPYRTERLCRADLVYDYVLVLDYNRAPIQSGRGSALFIHCWRKPRHPTAGCIAFSAPDLRWICENWSPRTRVAIW